MKKVIVMLIAAMSMTSTMPAFAQTQSEKDECLLASKNCLNQVDDIQKRMHRLNKEIRKGKKVYTADELKKLQEKLTETQELLRDLERPGR